MIVIEQDPALETIDEIEEFPAGTKAKNQINLKLGGMPCYVIFQITTKRRCSRSWMLSNSRHAPKSQIAGAWEYIHLSLRMLLS